MITVKDMMESITVNDEKIAFCFKLWIKELIEDSTDVEGKDWIIEHAVNEILNGYYCSDEEFKNKDIIFPKIIYNQMIETENTNCPKSPDGKHYTHPPMMGESQHCMYCGWKPRTDGVN